MKSESPSSTPFINKIRHMSLWDIAHRWSGFDPQSSSNDSIPIQVRDTLFAMLKGQLAQELGTTLPSGKTMRTRMYLPLWSNYLTNSDEEWDGTDAHKFELYEEYMNTIVEEPLFKVLHLHYKIISGSQPLDRQYLLNIHCDKSSLLKWSLLCQLPFPSFWFTEDSKAEAILEANESLFIDEGISRYQMRRSSKPPKGLIQSLTLAFKTQLSKDETADLEPKMGRKLSKEDIDQFWKRLSPAQKSRIVSREIAEIVWSEEKDLSITEVSKHPAIQKYGGGAYYHGSDTVTNWISGVAPPALTDKTGRKTT
jgi:hypothetical protein